eukprot:jgi/Botrbrau1/12008/Bobra.247_2s0013.1
MKDQKTQGWDTPGSKSSNMKPVRDLIARFEDKVAGQSPKTAVGPVVPKPWTPLGPSTPPPASPPRASSSPSPPAQVTSFTSNTKQQLEKPPEPRRSKTPSVASSEGPEDAAAKLQPLPQLQITLPKRETHTASTPAVPPGALVPRQQGLPHCGCEKPRCCAVGVSIYLHNDLPGSAPHGQKGCPALEVQLVSEAVQDAVTPPADIRNWFASGYSRRREGETSGTCVSGEIHIPDSWWPIGAVYLKKLPEKVDRVMVSRIELTLPNRGGELTPLLFTCHSWVHQDQMARIFFSSIARLPSQTPPALRALRQEELDTLKAHTWNSDGGASTDGERKGADRIYDYDVYNDLGQHLIPDLRRPIMGKERGGVLAYPRRLRTGRTVTCDGDEERVPNDGYPWRPLDEGFNVKKRMAFNGRTAAGAAQMSMSLAQVVFEKRQAKREFSRFAEVDALFNEASECTYLSKEMPVDLQMNAMDLLKWRNIMTTKQRRNFREGFGLSTWAAILITFARFFGKRVVRCLVYVMSGGSISGEALNTLEDGILPFVHALVKKWPPTLVRHHRQMLWWSDYEYGRGFLAGLNPVVIQAATRELLQQGGITAETPSRTAGWENTGATTEGGQPPVCRELHSCVQRVCCQNQPVLQGAGAGGLPVLRPLRLLPQGR